MSEADPRQPANAMPGWSVVHLFCALEENADVEAVERAIKQCQADDHQVVTAELVGHKGDFGVLALGPSLARLRRLQSELRAAGCVAKWSYVSLTEVSEYASGVPEEMKLARLRPNLPPEGMPAFCFYPMSKRRQAEGYNWYLLPYDERLNLMHGHGKTGRQFRGRVLQLVTGSTGLDDWEWGVTLFGRSLDDIKDCVYSMRFDEASARFAEFGPFVVGTIGTPAEILSTLLAR